MLNQMRVLPSIGFLLRIRLYRFSNAIVKFTCYSEGIWMQSMELLLQYGKEWIFVIWVWRVLSLVVDLVLLWRYLLIVCWSFVLHIINITLPEVFIDLLPDWGFKFRLSLYYGEYFESLTKLREICVLRDKNLSSIGELSKLWIDKIQNIALMVVLAKLMKKKHFFHKIFSIRGKSEASYKLAIFVHVW